MRRVAPTRCYLFRESPHLPLVVSVMPLCLTDVVSEWNLARGVLFVREPDGPLSPDLGVIVTTFQLTRREAALASLLVRGSDLADAASELGIGIGTPRGYLKQILAKTDTHRQAELVSLLLRSAIQIVR
jgi:DNA-binding CsgD family transcriptional regulator